jgi:ribonuclease HII
MGEYHQLFPQYEFQDHKGYGTSRHLSLLKQLGPCRLHRKSFRPLSNWKDQIPSSPEEPLVQADMWEKPELSNSSLRR